MTDEEGPFPEQTQWNTSPEWLGEPAAIDVDLRGMEAFAQHMLSLNKFAEGHRPYLDAIADVPRHAWENSVLPEGQLARALVESNQMEFERYLSLLATSLLSVGFAAKTIADLYAGSDEWGAADANAVLWAFGDATATPPANLPWYLAEMPTVKEIVDSGQAPTPDGKSTPDPSLLPDEPVITSLGNGVVQEVYTHPDGSTVTITRYPPSVIGGASLVTTVVRDQDGKVLRESSEVTRTTTVGNTTTTTVTTSSGGTVTGGHQTVVEVDGGRVVREAVYNIGADDDPSNDIPLSELTVQADGSQQVRIHNSEGELVREIHVGAQTPEVGSRVEDPGLVAIEALEEMDRTSP